MESGPVPQRERIQSLDIARGCAVLGVLLMNIWSFAGPQAFFDYPVAIADHAGAPVATWAVMHTLFEGSQRTLLSMLFGAGALFLIGRAERSGGPGTARGVYYRRTLGLILLGLVNAYVFMWPADILFTYGLAGLCLYPLRRLRARSLLLVALAVLVVPLVMRGFETSRLVRLEATQTAAVAAEARGENLTAPQRQAIGDWQEALQKARPLASDDKIVAGIRTMQSGTVGEIWARQATASFFLEAFVTTQWWFLDALAMMLVGMALYRAGMMGGKAWPAGRCLALAVAGFAVGLPIALWQTRTLLATDFHPVEAEIVKLSYDVRRLGMGFGWLMLIFAFAQSGGARAVKARIADVGRIALTNYLAQSILCGFVFYGFGLALYGRIAGYQLYYVVAAVWAVELAWSGWWLRHFQIGPFEWVLRSFVYRRPQPWGKGAGTSVSATPSFEGKVE